MKNTNARDQIVEKLKSFSNILIAVNDNPTVDQLAAALGLTLALNKSGKHATAVASGKMPDALEFLNPSKTFETSVDSLRDFIIALSKDKADHLRYKIVGDHVKIFITPYKSIISEKDLEFEQGNFNVDFVLALGVRDKENLDAALRAHGRIFHDATTAVMTSGKEKSMLADLNWHEENASGLSEMALELIESNAFDKKSLNKAVATAFLTGIVAETERFSNNKVNAKIMNTASKLILAGADQQLVIAKIREAEEKATRVDVQNLTTSPQAEISTKIEKVEQPAQQNDGAFRITRSEDNSAEAELEASLNNLSAQLVATPANAFAELNNLPTAAEVSATRVPETSQNLVFSMPNAGGDLTPTLSEVPAPAVEPIIEQIPLQDSTQNLGVAPVSNFQIPQNFTPTDLPAPLAEPVAEDFLTEAPAPAMDFSPAELTPISAPSFEENTIFEPAQNNTSSENLNFEAPKAELQFEEAPISAPEFPTTEIIPPAMSGQGSSRTILPISSDLTGDDYYNPAQNQVISQALNESPILTHEVPATENFDPNFGLPPLPPIPDFDQMMPPSLPELPDFGQLPELPALPPVDFGAPMASIPAPDANPALGTSATQQQAMTENLYPDPSQFKIPGM